METISFHSNQSFYPIVTKNIIICSPCLYMLYMKFGKNWLHGFRGDVVWKCWRTTTDGRRMPAYIISSPMSLRLRWAKNLSILFFSLTIYLATLKVYIKFEEKIWLERKKNGQIKGMINRILFHTIQKVIPSIIKFQNPRHSSSWDVFDTNFPMYYIGVRDGRKGPEDHWSCIAHLRAEDMLKSEVTGEKKFKHS